MARPKKPTAMKIIEGNPGRRPLPQNELMPVSPMPMAPPHLDGYALEEWNRMAPILYSIGLLFEADAAVFAAYCDSYGIWREASEQRAKMIKEGTPLCGLVMYTAQGNVIQHPLIGIMNVAKRDMLKYAQEFGLTPVVRAKIASLVKDRDKPKSKFGDLINA